ncbi:alpha/beta hydrolase fold [Musa troglodytarum]|uniref:Maspardin n=1 Tax=Musa troglodytarum TaxID=320322 RepID=A0A9E7EIL2_9LILI|nr:alpha/beta hydrolase fold [Musa troglodytarum]
MGSNPRFDNSHRLFIAYSDRASSSLSPSFRSPISATNSGMKGGISPAPGDYAFFKSQVPLHKISIGNKQWRYYDFGPKAVPPLICIPGIAGTADVYYKQIKSLSMKVHLYGTSLGGFLALVFAQHRPRRVKSLVLSNAFLETHKFAAAMPWSPVVNWTPSFLLKRYILSGIRDGPHEPFIADSVDFVVGQVETLSRDDLSSRLKLNANVASVGPLLLSDSFITIMDTNDYCAVPQQLKDQVSERFPGARRAILKTGGDFPFLSRPDEVNLYLQLHLRWVGVEAQPDKVPGDDGDNGRSNYESRGGEHFDDLPGPANTGGSNGAHQPESSGPSRDSDGSPQPEPSGPTDHTSNEIGNMTVLGTSPSLLQASVVVLAMLQYLVTELCITWKPVLNI